MSSLGTDLSILRRLLFKENAMPLHLTFFVTGRCNARCKMCFYWKELNKEKDELKLDEIRKISSSMDSIGWLILTGGEPFLRKDLAKIAQIFCSQNSVKNISLPTNALLTDTIVNQAREILVSCPNTFLNLILSLDGIGKDHDEIRGVPGNFEKFQETYRRLQPLRKEFKNFGLSTVITHSACNQDKLGGIYKYLRENMEFDNINLNLVRGRPKDPATKEIDISCYERFNSQLNNDLAGGRLPFHRYRLAKFILAKDMLQREMISRTFRETKMIYPCYAGRLNAVITEAGDAYPCELLDAKIGNLRDFDFDFRRLWFSNRAKQVRKGIKDSKCYCTHECFWATNLLFNPAAYPKILRNLVLPHKPRNRTGLPE